MFGKKEKQSPDLEFFTIYDTKSQSYGEPISAVNQSVLLRDVLNMFQDPKQQKSRHFLNAEDYTIFKIASYDKSSGLLEVLSPMQSVIGMHDLRAMAQAAAPVGINPT